MSAMIPNELLIHRFAVPLPPQGKACAFSALKGMV